MSLEITGKLIHLMPEESGTGKTGNGWRKKNFVIETSDQYPKKIAFALWGDKIDLLESLNTKEGDVLKVSFEVESREYAGKWFTDAKAWRIQKESAAESHDSSMDDGFGGFEDMPPPDDDANLPF